MTSGAKINSIRPGKTLNINLAIKTAKIILTNNFIAHRPVIQPFADCVFHSKCSRGDRVIGQYSDSFCLFFSPDSPPDSKSVYR